jgi:hypothetical protein
MFAAIGFGVGFMAFLASPAVSKALGQIIPQLALDQSIVFATICGAAGAAISTSIVSVWARRP